MVGEQVELVQDEENRTAAAAIAWPETPNGDLAKMLRECQQSQNANHLKVVNSSAIWRKSKLTVAPLGLCSVLTFFQGLEQKC